MVDVYKAISGRRSVRSFEKKDVPEDVVEKILKAACQAPSAGNLQPWRFYVVRGEELRKELAWGAFGQAFVYEAPVVVVVCADLSVSAAGYGERGRTLYALQDTAAATQTLLLAAYVEGLGTCWVGAFDEQAVRQVLDLPEHIRPVSLIPLGFPAKTPSSRGRKRLEEVATFL